MIAQNSFDEVHDCQEVFRLLLQAMANPGEIVSLAVAAEKMPEPNANILILAMTLLDKETSFCVVDDETLAETIAQITYAKKVKEKASFIIATTECSDNMIERILDAASPGTLVEPHTNSVLIITVDTVSDSNTCLLKGPGIKGEKAVGLTPYAKKWINQRDQMEFEYPTGLDFYFITPSGQVVAIPRKVKMEG